MVVRVKENTSGKSLYACILCFHGSGYHLNMGRLYMIICPDCGTEFMQKSEDNIVCPDCAAKNKRESVYRIRVCRQCGEKFMGYPRSFYCESCNMIRKKEQKKRSNERQKQGITRKSGSIDICEICGDEYIVNGARQRYCKKCNELFSD